MHVFYSQDVLLSLSVDQTDEEIKHKLMMLQYVAEYQGRPPADKNHEILAMLNLPCTD